METESIEIWTDGSNQRNGQADSPGGCSAIVCINGVVKAELGRALFNTTNNRAELEGIKLGLEYAIEQGWNDKRVVIVTDSAYCEGLLTAVARVGDNYRWKFQASKNRELVLLVRNLVKRFPRFEIRRVKGHRKENPLNCRADHYAKAVYDGRGS